jgi:hypothetical protein
MWDKEYQDYKRDQPLIKEQNDRITGCEMHELNGWGNTFETPHAKKKPPGFFRRLFNQIFPI